MAIAVAAAVALLAVVIGAVALTRGGDDKQEQVTTPATDSPRTTTTSERASTSATDADTTVAASTTTASRRTTTTGSPTTTTTVPGSTTTATGGSTTAPSAPADPGSAPPPVITDVRQGIFPADVTALRANLNAFAFPEWWPMPATLATPGDPYATVQGIGARDSLTKPENGKRTGSTDWSTTWLDPNPDLAAAEATWVPKVPADRFKVAEGVAKKSTSTKEGKSSVGYLFPAATSDFGSYFSVDLQEAVTDAGQHVGVFVELRFSGPLDDKPPAVPLGTGPGKQFLAAAPVSPEMVWNATNVRINGGSGIIATSPYGNYEATWYVKADQLDSVIAYLGDPTHFTGPLQPVAPGKFTSDDLWSADVVYPGLEGTITLLKPSSGNDDVLVSLQLDLAE